MHDQNGWRPYRESDRRKIFHRIVRLIFEHEGREPMRIAVEKQGIAIRLRFGDRCARHDAGRPVIHDHLLAQTTAKSRREQARRGIGNAPDPRGDNANGLARKILARYRARANDGYANRNDPEHKARHPSSSTKSFCCVIQSRDC